MNQMLWFSFRSDFQTENVSEIDYVKNGNIHMVTMYTVSYGDCTVSWQGEKLSASKFQLVLRAPISTGLLPEWNTTDEWSATTKSCLSF